jgi:hypothetical protein
LKKIFEAICTFYPKGTDWGKRFDDCVTETAEMIYYYQEGHNGGDGVLPGVLGDAQHADRPRN